MNKANNLLLKHLSINIALESLHVQINLIRSQR